MGWTLSSLIQSAGIAAELRSDAPVAGLAYSAHDVVSGDLFFCVPGSRADGHDFAPEAVRAGARALVVERWLDLDVPQVRVARVREAMGPLAAAFFGRPSETMAVAGVTGTNGKTTVTYLLEAMGQAAGRRAGVVGTIESRVGGERMPSVRTTPESVDLQRLLARMRDAGAEVVVMEVTSHALDQGRATGTRLACAGFTNLTQDHLDYHQTMEAYFAAKARLFTGGYTSRAAFNLSDPYGRRLAETISGLDVLTYGWGEGDVRCEGADMTPGGTLARLSTPAGRAEVRLDLVGRYNVDNLMCATALALHLRLGLDAVVAGALALRNVPGRLERVDAGQPFTVLVDYAHTPDALEHALRASRELAAGRLIVVFGCGGDRDRGKRPVMGQAATTLADLAVITSDNPRSEDPLAIIAEIQRGAASGGTCVTEPDRRQAIALALREAAPGDVILIAGKGHESGQTFADRTVPFDDRTVARELLEAIARA